MMKFLLYRDLDEVKEYLEPKLLYWLNHWSYPFGIFLWSIWVEPRLQLSCWFGTIKKSEVAQFIKVLYADLRLM